MQRCDFRYHRECSCKTGECDQLKPMLDLRETPIIRFSAAQHFTVAVLVSAFFASIGWGALHSANEGYRKQALIEQENVAWKR